MFEQIDRDRVAVQFAGSRAATEPLTWGQKAILHDIEESGHQFTMGGRFVLPAGSTIADAAARLSGVMSRHAALRMRLRIDSAGVPYQEIAGSGQVGMTVLTFPDDADPDDVTAHAAELMDTGPLEWLDFQQDWPLRMTVLQHRGHCVHLVWSLSHLVADGGAHLLILADMVAAEEVGQDARDPDRPEILDIVASEKEPQARLLSSRAMRYWESQLRHLPAQTFGEPRYRPAQQSDHRHWQARFRSPAAYLAMLSIAERTGTDASRVTLAIVATAIARATRVNPVTVKVMMNNRFRPGLAQVIAPIAQTSAITIDVADCTVDEVVARARGASLTAGMRAYYDPDDLQEVIERLDAERGYPAMITCRVNDQRAMVMRADAEASLDGVTPEQIDKLRADSSLTWIGPMENMHEQANIVLENRADVVSVWIMWDRWSITDVQVEALMRAVEEVAIEAAFDPEARTKVLTAG